MSEYRHACAYLDPLGLVVSDHGSWREIELVLSDDPDRDPPSLTDPVDRTDAPGARRLASELLELAAHAGGPQTTAGVRR